MMMTDEEIEASPIWEAVKYVPRDHVEGAVGLPLWGNWPVTSLQVARGETRSTTDGLRTKMRYRIMGGRWSGWQWKCEGAWLKYPGWVVRIQKAQNWIWKRSFMNQTVTILGASFSREFLEIPYRLNWILWATGWPMWLMLKLLRRVAR